jgi:hypothetical protein
MAYDAFREFMRTRRAEKQRIYNARSRLKAKKAAKPAGRDVFRSAFQMLSEHAGAKRDDMMGYIVDRLVARGFDESESWQVVERMVCGPTISNVDTFPHEFVDC